MGQLRGGLVARVRGLGCRLADCGELEGQLRRGTAILCRLTGSAGAFSRRRLVAGHQVAQAPRPAGTRGRVRQAALQHVLKAACHGADGLLRVRARCVGRRAALVRLLLHAGQLCLQEAQLVAERRRALPLRRALICGSSAPRAAAELCQPLLQRLPVAVRHRQRAPQFRERRRAVALQAPRQRVHHRLRLLCARAQLRCLVPRRLACLLQRPPVLCPHAQLLRVFLHGAQLLLERRDALGAAAGLLLCLAHLLLQSLHLLLRSVELLPAGLTIRLRLAPRRCRVGRCALALSAQLLHAALQLGAGGALLGQLPQRGFQLLEQLAVGRVRVTGGAGSPQARDFGLKPAHRVGSRLGFGLPPLHLRHLLPETRQLGLQRLPLPLAGGHLIAQVRQARQLCFGLVRALLRHLQLLPQPRGVGILADAEL
mmetsp:Transcript_22206/g.57863  ORF Transcript_22206/g.57863 Transcript_22206/m.57863 type:complete len:427 (-) Transcript_22206:856-2136(-)